MGIGIPLTICAIIATIFAISNYYIGKTDTSCVTSENITLKLHSDVLCTARSGCVNYQIYFYVEASLLCLFLALYIMQCVCSGVFCKALTVSTLIICSLWSAISAYMFFERPIGECSRETKSFIIISTAATLFGIPTVLALCYAMCDMSCKKKKVERDLQYV